MKRNGTKTKNKKRFAHKIGFYCFQSFGADSHAHGAQRRGGGAAEHHGDAQHKHGCGKAFAHRIPSFFILLHAHNAASRGAARNAADSVFILHRDAPAVTLFPPEKWGSGGTRPEFTNR